jgi:hypothetical protein
MRARQGIRRIVIVCLIVAMAGRARGQEPVPPVDDPAVAALEQGRPEAPESTPRHGSIKSLLKNLVDDAAHLPARENVWWAASGGVAALAVHPADESVNQAMVNSSFAHDFFKPGAVIGAFPTLLGASMAVYAVGRARDQPKVSHTGLDLIESLILSEGVVEGIKVATQRQRPDGTSWSFPSGHASDTFAFATALERHLGWRFAVPAYTLASYVAISRLPANRHWLSDVVFGSSVGIIAGRTVTRHGRQFPIALVATPGGIAFAYVRNGR